MPKGKLYIEKSDLDETFSQLFILLILIH
jgi:hypothetical protein